MYLQSNKNVYRTVFSLADDYAHSGNSKEMRLLQPIHAPSHDYTMFSTSVEFKMCCP
jgi:hypothetical protein